MFCDTSNLISQKDVSKKFPPTQQYPRSLQSLGDSAETFSWVRIDKCDSGNMVTLSLHQKLPETRAQRQFLLSLFRSTCHKWMNLVGQYLAWWPVGKLGDIFLWHLWWGDSWWPPASQRNESTFLVARSPALWTFEEHCFRVYFSLTDNHHWSIDMPSLPLKQPSKYPMSIHILSSCCHYLLHIAISFPIWAFSACCKGTANHYNK